MDEILIQKFLEKQQVEEENLENLETNLEMTKNDSESKEKNYKRMNELDELVYAMEDLNLSEHKLNVFMNKGEIGGSQEKFERSTSIKEEWQEPEKDEKNFTNKAKMNNDFIKQYHSSDKLKFMPNRLPTGDIGTQFLDLDCKRDPENSLDL
ncbi:hypothetical protein H5410_060679 [Solanum commersonii]|uniref:Uncharacterized protein n=1 Tax=Solanum commersonii TaxID=4109 RepID=A0A9J5W646_SOLCO|nr:hypothetical protein H5410_060679 [Solanum commersonii]